MTNPYSLPLVASATVSLIIAILAWRRRAAPGALPLALMLLTTTIWAGANVFVLELSSPEARLLAFNILLPGSLLGTPAFCAFALQYTGRGHWLTRRNVLALCLIPVLSLILAWTTGWHGLFYAVLDFTTPLPGGTWRVEPGSLLPVYLTYAYLVVLFSLVIIIIAFVRAPRPYRGQAGTILIGTLIPLVGNVIYNVIIGTGAGQIDPTPFLFTLMGILYAYGLFGFRLFDLVPVARHTLIEHMTDGMLVVDAQNRILDINPAAARLMQLSGKILGLRLDDLLVRWPESVWHYHNATNVQAELSFDQAHFDLRIEPLADRRGQYTGRLILIRDITRRRQAESALRQANESLHIQLAEIESLHVQLREQAIRDPLTGLFNRRYLQEMLEREIARAIRENTPLGVVMLDIDHFKQLNDQNGHRAGDVVLRALGELLSTHSRVGDIACRYGGEEFVVILPGTTLEVVARRADEWRAAFENLRIAFESKLLTTTLSLGVTLFPVHGSTSDALLQSADQALYRSKEAGRNRVSVA